MTNHVMAADSYFPIIYKVNLLENIFGVTSVIWLLVSVVILFLYCILYWITKTQLRDAVHLCDNVYLSDKIQTPAVYGIIKPRILMPLIYKDKDLSFIVAHEKAHIRRCRQYVAYDCSANSSFTLVQSVCMAVSKALSH